VWNAHNTVSDSKRSAICGLAVYTVELSFNVFFKLNDLHICISHLFHENMSRDLIVDRHCLPVQNYVPCRQHASDVAENLGKFLVRSVQVREMTLN